MKANSPAPAAHYALTLMEYRGDRKTVYGEIDIPTDIFKAMQKKAKAAGDPAFNDLLARGLAEMTKPVDSCELENSTSANNALMQLLVENIEFQRRDSNSSAFSAGPGSETLCFGIFQLVSICRERLAKAMEVAS